MRKLMREMIRRQAEKEHYKPSRAVHVIWERYQNKKRGEFVRLANVAKGTHKKNTWRNRVAAASRGV